MEEYLEDEGGGMKKGMMMQKGSLLMIQYLKMKRMPKLKMKMNTISLKQGIVYPDVVQRSMLGKLHILLQTYLSLEYVPLEDGSSFLHMFHGKLDAFDDDSHMMNVSFPLMDYFSYYPGCLESLSTYLMI